MKPKEQDLARAIHTDRVAVSFHPLSVVLKSAYVPRLIPTENTNPSVLPMLPYNLLTDDTILLFQHGLTSPYLARVSSKSGHETGQ